MTLYDWALQRRQNWKAEGFREGYQAGYKEGLEEARQAGYKEGLEEARQAGYGYKEGLKAGGRRAFRAHIAAILADESLTPEVKIRGIAIINATKPDLGA